jgi:hypothetical protein
VITLLLCAYYCDECAAAEGIIIMEGKRNIAE